MHKKCTFSAHFVRKISMFVHFKMYKCTKIRDYFRENVFPFFPIFLNIFLIFLENIFGKIRDKDLGSYRFHQVFWVDFLIKDMRKTLRGQFFVALEFWNFRRFHQVFGIFYGTIKPCRDGSRWVPKFWDQLLELGDHLNLNKVLRIFLRNCNLAEMGNFWVSS